MPLVIVTVASEIEQAPLARITGVAPELLVAVTVKIEVYGALAGAPVKVTAGAICTCWVTDPPLPVWLISPE